MLTGSVMSKLPQLASPGAHQFPFKPPAADYVFYVFFLLLYSPSTRYGLRRNISGSQSGPRTCLRKRNPDPTPGRQQGTKQQRLHHKSDFTPLSVPGDGSQRWPAVSQ